MNPIINVSTCGLSKYTTSKDKVPCTSQVGWREHLYFEVREIDKSKIEEETIQIKIKNKSFLKDEIIGVYDFDVTKLYFQEKHCI